MSIFILHLKTGDVYACPRDLPKRRLLKINVATAMLCNTNLVFRKGISLLLLVRKQEKTRKECNNTISL